MRKEKAVIFILSILLIFSIFYISFQEKSTLKNAYKNIISDNKTDEDFSEIQFYKPTEKGIVGEYDEDKNFRRLDESDKDNVRNIIWDLSQNSSGIQIHFTTNSSKIAVNYTLSNFSNGGNINNVAKNGIDLYLKKQNSWNFVNAGIPLREENTLLLAQNLDKANKEFVLNLPLYNTIENIEIGIEKSSNIKFQSHFNNKMVIYGTSITQGASASRPGLAYSNILSRKLSTEIINFGFSGNGHFEKNIAEILCKINADFYVIDCTPNSSPEIINKNTKDFFEKLRQCKTNTPIIVLESIIRENSKTNIGDENTFGTFKYIQKQNRELKKVVSSLNSNQKKNIYYISADSLIGNDTEGTVDGTHLNDLGMERISNAIYKEIQKAKL